MAHSSLRNSSPDYVYIDVPLAAAAAAQQSPRVMATVTPSWLPKRPSHLPSGSTLQSLSTAAITAMTFDSDGGAGPTSHQRYSAAASGSDDYYQRQDPAPGVSLRHAPVPSSACSSRMSLTDARTRWEPMNQTTMTKTPDTHLRVAIATPPKFQSPTLYLEPLRDPSWKTRHRFYLSIYCGVLES